MLFRTVYQLGKLLNVRRLQAKTKVQTDVLNEFLYADDMDKNASSEAKMQRAMDQVSQSCDNYDLTISTEKTEVVHEPALGKQYNEPTITGNEQKLKVADKFNYHILRPILPAITSSLHM